MHPNLCYNKLFRHYDTLDAFVCVCVRENAYSRKQLTDMSSNPINPNENTRTPRSYENNEATKTVAKREKI